MSKLRMNAQNDAPDRCEPAWGLAHIDHQNQAFEGTGGVSAGNRDQGFRPAYRHRETGHIVLSRFADGRPAPIHLLDGLPQEWLMGCAGDGPAIAVDAQVEAGFVRDGEFYTREAAARMLAGDDDPGRARIPDRDA